MNMDIWNTPPLFAMAARREYRRDCRKYKLLGKCDHGDDCRFAHRYRAPRVFTGRIQLPKGLPLAVAIGKKRSNLRPILSAVEFQIQPSETSKGEVDVIAADENSLSIAMEKLSALFAQVYSLGPTWCYLHTEGITEVAGKLLLEFKRYQGKSPTHLFQGDHSTPMYEVCCCESSTSASGASLAHDTSLEKLKKLNPTASPLDSMDGLHKALDSIHSGAVSSNVAVTVGPTARARIVTEYKDDIKDRLQGALEWALKNQEPNHMFKLEARFGKVLWFHLPNDVTANDNTWGVEQFADFVFTDTIHAQCFNTDVKKQNAEQLRTEMSSSDPKPLLETFDIKLSTTIASAGQGTGRHKLDLRLMHRGGRLEVILLKQNETKVVTFDVLNLHRQHDVRISLNRLEILPEAHPLHGVARRLYQSLKIPKPGTLELTPCTDDWNVEFLRHKKRTAYVIDDKYMVTVTAIQEYFTNWQKLPKGRTVTVNFEDLPEHFEVEFHNSSWECTFGRDVGFTPEQALALHTEHPAVTPQLAASIPHPWGVQDILQDYEEFLDYLDQLNESLGMVVA